MPEDFEDYDDESLSQFIETYLENEGASRVVLIETCRIIQSAQTSA